MAKTLVPIQEHAAKLMEQIQQDIPAEQDPRSLAAAGAVPAFSKGTIALDENTGRPIVPTFSDETVAIPKPTETQGGDVAKTVLDSKATDTKERDAQGRFVGDPNAVAQPEAAKQEETPQQEQGAQAAEKVAEAIVAQPQDDYEEWEWEDPDLADAARAAGQEPVKIPIRVKKQFATTVKRGYERRAEFDRIRGRWGNAAPILVPLLQDGRFSQILPLLQRAMTDPAYGEFVWQAYQRAQQGLPLTPQQQAAVEQTQAPVQNQELGFVDPLLESTLTPIMAELAAMKQWRQSLDSQQSEAAQRQRQLEVQQNQTALTLQAAHTDIATMFPGTYRTDQGPSDPNWQRASKYANDAGYIEAYGLRGGIVFAAQQLAAIEAERLAATASPAAAALENVSQQQVELARQQAAQSARAASSSGGTTAPPAAPRLQAPSTRMADGKMKPPDQYLAENLAYLQQSRAS